MRTLLRYLDEGLRNLGSEGAARNALLEVDRVAQCVAELDLQLRRVADLTPRQAA